MNILSFLRTRRLSALILMAGFIIAIAGTFAVSKIRNTPPPSSYDRVVALSTLAPAAPSTPRITWSQPEISITLSPGDSATQDVTVTSSVALTNVNIEAVKEIAGFITFAPGTLAALPANQPQLVRLSFAVAQGIAPGTYQGTLHLRSGSQTLPQTLKVVINAWSAFSAPELGISFKFPPGWVVSLIGDEVTVSSIPLDSELVPDSLAGACKVDFNTVAKPGAQQLIDWLSQQMTENGDPAPISIRPITVNSLTGLRVVTGENVLVDTVFLPLSETKVLSVGIVCGDDIRANGEMAFERIVSTIAIH